MSRRVSIPAILAALLAATSASVLLAQQRAAKNQTPAKSAPDDSGSPISLRDLTGSTKNPRKWAWIPRFWMKP